MEQLPSINLIHLLIDSSGGIMSVNNSISINMYYDMAEKMIADGKAWLVEEDWQNAFVIFLRLINLIHYTIPSHSSFEDIRYRKQKCLWCRHELENKLMDNLEYILIHVRKSGGNTYRAHESSDRDYLLPSKAY